MLRFFGKSGISSQPSSRLGIARLASARFIFRSCAFSAIALRIETLSNFVYSDGTYVTFDLAGAIDTYFGWINDQGDIVGYTYTVPPVPEPSGLVLFATGLSCIAGPGFRHLRSA